MLSVIDARQPAPVLACGALWLGPSVGPVVLSWKQVALSAVSAGVTAGVGSYLPNIGGIGPVGNAAVRGAIGNAATQGIAVATGLQSSFNWRGVAASAVGAGVGQAVGGAVGMNDAGFRDLSFGEQFGRRLVTGLAAGAATAVARGGRVSVQQVAVDSFGNTVGQGIVDSLQPDGASAYGYRNGADIDSDNFNPASAHGYRNGLDVDSDRVADMRVRSEAMYGLASEGPVRLGGPSSAVAVADWSRRIDSGIVDASENLGRIQRFLEMRPMANAQVLGSGDFFGLLGPEFGGPAAESSNLRLGERLRNWAQVRGFRTDEQAEAFTSLMRTGRETFGPKFIEEAYRNGDIPSGPADLVIGLLGGGRSGHQAVRTADDAAILTERALARTAREAGPLRELEVGTFKELDAARRKFGAVGALDLDHVPSKAALRIAREDELGRLLTGSEIRQIENEGISVAIDRTAHRDSRTYAGRNNALKIDDAADLHSAVKKDLTVFIENAASRGLSEYQVMKTVAVILMQSRQRGLIK